MKTKQIKLTQTSTRVAGTSTVYIIEDENRDKYEFWSNKQDGQPTKAFTQFQAMRPLAGDMLEINYDEKPNTFTNQQGQVINAIKRNIAFFTENPVARQSQPQDTTQNSIQAPPVNPYQEPIPTYHNQSDDLNKLVLEVKRLGGLVESSFNDIKAIRLALVGDKIVPEEVIDLHTGEHVDALQKVGLVEENKIEQPPF